MGRLLTLLIAAVVAAVAGCTSPSASPPEDASPGASTGTFRLGMMPKQKGIPYFNACERGAREAAADLGDVELTFDGPIEDKSEQQSSMLDTWVVRRFDAIAVACNDPEQISTSLARARDDGISVITYDADANPTASRRQFFVNQAGVQDIARTLVDEMAKQAGEDAKVGVVSSSPTAPNQSAWLKAMEEYRREKYPRMQVLPAEYAGENQKTSFEKAQSLLKAYPDMDGIWGMTSVAFPGAAQAVEQASKAGQIAVVGLGTPQVMKEFVDRGVVKSVVLWNPVDLGYLTVHVARAVAKGELTEGATSFQAGRLGALEVRGQEVLLGPPMIFNAENIGEFDF